MCGQWAVWLLCWVAMVATAAPPTYAPVQAGRPLQFPTDFGSHPEFRTEWWYVTGWLKTNQGESLGFQITFFRTKPDVDENNPSAFAPRQLLIAHCAISDPKHGRLWQDQRIRRAGMGLVEAQQGDTDVRLERWSLRRGPSGYSAVIDGEDFSLNLRLVETQPMLVNGIAGISRKGPEPQAASFYYSLPHLKVSGEIARQKTHSQVTGEAWFDHEWSSEYLDSTAVGWEWIGINLIDGGALMAFRIRDADGNQRWGGGTYRDAKGNTNYMEQDQVEFRATRHWQSPRTGVVYPVEWDVSAAGRVFNIKPLFDDQENDTRLSTGAIYWEGAVRAFENNALTGAGYLELTGYGEPLQLK